MKVKQAIGIEGSNLNEYVNAYNKAMAEIGVNEIIQEDRIDTFATIVYYFKQDEVKTVEPTSCDGKCENCKYFQYTLDRFGEIDRRYKFGTCKATDAHVNKNMRPCEMYKEK